MDNVNQTIDYTNSESIKDFFDDENIKKFEIVSDISLNKKNIKSGSIGTIILFGKLEDGKEIVAKNNNNDTKTDCHNDKNANVIKELKILIEIKTKNKTSNLIDFIGYTINENKLYIIMEKLDISLSEYLLYNKSDKFVTKYEKIIDGLINGIHDLHSLGFYHNDIKPDNIMLKEFDNCTKLIDMGISKKIINFVKKPRLAGSYNYIDPIYAISLFDNYKAKLSKIKKKLEALKKSLSSLYDNSIDFEIDSDDDTDHEYILTKFISKYIKEDKFIFPYESLFKDFISIKNELKKIYTINNEKLDCNLNYQITKIIQELALSYDLKESSITQIWNFLDKLILNNILNFGYLFLLDEKFYTNCCAHYQSHDNIEKYYLENVPKELIIALKIFNQIKKKHLIKYYLMCYNIYKLSKKKYIFPELTIFNNINHIKTNITTIIENILQNIRYIKNKNKATLVKLYNQNLIDMIVTINKALNNFIEMKFQHDNLLNICVSKSDNETIFDDIKIDDTNDELIDKQILDLPFVINPDSYSIGIIIWQCLNKISNGSEELIDIKNIEKTPDINEKDGKIIKFMMEYYGKNNNNNIIKNFIAYDEETENIKKILELNKLSFDNPKMYISKYYKSITYILDKIKISDSAKIILNNLLILLLIGEPILDINMEEIYTGKITLNDQNNYNFYHKLSSDLIKKMWNLYKIEKNKV